MDTNKVKQVKSECPSLGMQIEVYTCSGEYFGATYIRHELSWGQVVKHNRSGALRLAAMAPVSVKSYRSSRPGSRDKFWSDFRAAAHKVFDEAARKQQEARDMRISAKQAEALELVYRHAGSTGINVKHLHGRTRNVLVRKGLLKVTTVRRPRDFMDMNTRDWPEYTVVRLTALGRKARTAYLR